jgi:hypothetical protein
VPAAGLNRNVLFCSDRISHRRALQRGAQVEPPQFLECSSLYATTQPSYRAVKTRPPASDSGARSNLFTEVNPEVFASFTRRIPAAKSGLGSPESAASNASRKTAASLPLIVPGADRRAFR